MLAATLVMYAAATVHWASQLDLLFFLQKYTLGVLQLLCDGVVPSFESGTDLVMGIDAAISSHFHRCVPTAMLSINIILSDADVLWRAWILRTGRVFRAGSTLLLLGTIVSAVTSVAQMLSTHSPPTYGGCPFPPSRANVWATSVIGYKAWQHRRLIREHSQHGSTRTRAEKVMVLFVESGLLYCLLWASLTVNAFIQVFPVPVDLQPGVRVSTAGNVFLNGGLIQLIGIYPTIVIILACLEIAHCDRDFIYNQTIPAPPEIPLQHITVETQDTMTSREETQERSIRPGRECNLIFAIRLPFHRTYLANVIYLQGIGIVIESRHELALSPVGAHLRTRRW